MSICSFACSNDFLHTKRVPVVYNECMSCSSGNLEVRVAFKKRHGLRHRLVSSAASSSATNGENVPEMMQSTANGVSVGYYLERLRHIASSSSVHLQHPGMVTQFNPHYEFSDGGIVGGVGTEALSIPAPPAWKLDDLGELSRDQLVFIR
jgi:hypothetical protein